MSDKKAEQIIENEETATSSRRDFFRMASVGAAGAAAAALTGGAPEADAAEAKSEHRGYQLTDHVKKAYDVSRF